MTCYHQYNGKCKQLVAVHDSPNVDTCLVLEYLYQSTLHSSTVWRNLCVRQRTHNNIIILLQESYCRKAGTNPSYLINRVQSAIDAVVCMCVCVCKQWSTLQIQLIRCKIEASIYGQNDCAFLLPIYGRNVLLFIECWRMPRHQDSNRI